MSEGFKHMTQEHFRAGIRWVINMSESDKWDLTDAEVASLLGGIEIKTYLDLKYKAANDIPLTMDSIIYEHLSLLLGIWKCLKLFVPAVPEGLAYSWFKAPNSIEFMTNKSIKEYLLEKGDIEAFYQVRNYLCSRCC